MNEPKINQQWYQLGAKPSVIRTLFAYGLEQAAFGYTMAANLEEYFGPCR